jgi:Fe-Mn family superoxide dismutase
MRLVPRRAPRAARTGRREHGDLHAARPPYDFAALEPHISGKIMELHHDKHHQAYVTGANTALEQLAEARESGNLANVNKLEKDLAFNLGGHVNHSIFWTNLAPPTTAAAVSPRAS